MPITEVAAKLKKKVAEIEAWENGNAAPSYPQLEKLAYEMYKRPLALFFLPEPPDEPSTRTEFRTLPEHDIDALDRHTVFLIRKARAFQMALHELFAGRTPAEAPIWRNVRLSVIDPPAKQASRIREALGVSLAEQKRWADHDEALKRWRSAIESVGIFVFKNTFKQKTISGLCLSSTEFPVVMVNNSTTKTRQIFSLLHEVAHVLFQRNGISTFDERTIEGLPPRDRTIERFCNAVAAEVLVPLSDFRNETRSWTGAIESMDDRRFATLAERYHVSRAVILRRFLDAGRVSVDFYQRKADEWDAQKRPQGAGGNYYATQNVYLSERFLQEVVVRYARRQLTRDEAADFIGVAPKNFSRFEDLVLRTGAA
jgi:Zn-dependent peptidase ImmA (M78 family)